MGEIMDGLGIGGESREYRMGDNGRDWEILGELGGIGR